MTSSESKPLVVDLDGTLVRTDLLLESVFALPRRNVLLLFLLPFWLMKGKAHLKQQIAARVEIDAVLLPYHEEFVRFLNTEHAKGRRLILATASNRKFADAVAQSLGIFHDVLASDSIRNLSGRAKLSQVRKLIGEGPFDYAGNAMVDLDLWSEAEDALLVNPERGVIAETQRRNIAGRIFDDRSGSRLGHYLAALRLHQWLKNLLLFVPLMMAHRFDETALVGQALLAFLSFGLCASSVYVLNDLLDMADDRQHPTKRERPFAAGNLPLHHGAILVPVLLLCAVALAFMLPVEFGIVLGLYYALTLSYSLRLKRSPIIDVLVLAVLYTLRVIAGAAAVLVVPSFWLLAFSMFLFLSLALVKRFTELLIMQQSQRTEASGRGYRTSDLETLSQFGTASGYLAVLVLALYVNSSAVLDLYTHPEIIWMLCPLLLYIVTRIWFLARRGELHEDPVVFVVRDHQSQVLGLIGAVLLWLAA